MSSRIRRLGALIIACFAAACGAPEGDDADTGGAALSDRTSAAPTKPAPTPSSSTLLAAGTAHASAIKGCLQHHDAAADTSQAADVRVQAAKDEWQCLAGANDALVAAIEPVAKSSGAFPDGVGGLAKDYRASAQALCDGLTALKPSWDLKKYACYGNREFDIAEVLNAYGNVTSEPPANVWAAFGSDGTTFGPAPPDAMIRVEGGGDGLSSALLDQNIASEGICSIAQASYTPPRSLPGDCGKDARWLLYVEVLLTTKEDTASTSPRCWALDESPSICRPPA